jgi:hypothetical protein
MPSNLFRLQGMKSVRRKIGAIFDFHQKERLGKKP